MIKSRFYGPFRDAEDASNLVNVEVFKVSQRQESSYMARQFGQCVVDQIRVILNVLNIWLITSLGRLLCEFVQKGLLPFLVPSPVSEFVAGNTVCPVSKTGLIVQFLDPADDGHPGILNDIRRRVIITCKLPGISPQTRLPSCDKIFKGF